MICLIVSEILLLPVGWPPSWISGAPRTSMSHETGGTSIGKLGPENMGEAFGILSLCAQDIHGGIFTPPPVAGERRKKPLPGEGLMYKI